MQRQLGDPSSAFGVQFTLGICAYTELESVVGIVEKTLPEISESSQVVVVTPSKEIAEVLAGTPSVYVVLESAREGKTAAMNKLLRAVSGGVLVYASGDIALNHGTVRALVNELVSTPLCGAVIGHAVVANRLDGVMGRVGSLIWGVFNRVSQKLDEESKLAQPNDLFAVRRDAVDFIPDGVVNDDTYLMMSVKRKGLLVRKTTVPFYISGPSTPVDYIVQRSRITLGHLQTIQMLNTAPTIFQFSAIRNMGTFVKAVSGEGPWGVVAALTALPLELFSWAWGGLTALMGRKVTIWTQAVGTKNVLDYLNDRLAPPRIGSEPS